MNLKQSDSNKNQKNEAVFQTEDTALINDRPIAAAKNAEEIAAAVLANNDYGVGDDGTAFSDNVRVLSPTRLVLKRFFRSKLSMTGLVILVVLFVFAFLGPLFQFLPFVWREQAVDRDVQSVTITIVEIQYEVDGETYIAYEVMEDVDQINAKSKPSALHLLGTDEKGYDIFSRLLYGGRVSLTIGFVVVILQTLIGILLGGLAGYFGKWLDNVVMRVVDILNCVPTLPLMLIISSGLSETPIGDVAKLYIMMGLLTLLGWAGTARMVRGQILSLREQEFMLAAEATGLSVPRKIFRHLIPNVMPQLIVSMTLGLGSIILTEATLGFLGLGLPSNYATWGNMINAAANDTYLRAYPNFWIPPGICIVLAVVAFNFIGDGLRDAFDPKSRR